MAVIYSISTLVFFAAFALGCAAHYTITRAQAADVATMRSRGGGA